MIRVGNCSGFYGDRLTAMREMLEGGQLDYLTGDYLAELTMLILGRDRLKDESLGYAKTFVAQMTDCMALAKSQGVKIVANAGGLNPSGLAERLRQIADEKGLDIQIAHIDGDDVRDRADEFGFGNVLTANVYMGAFGIADALRGGADVVVTGRVTDASVVVGPAIAHFGWGPSDVDQLAGAVVAGHVIECGTQATGGNFAGFTSIDMSRPLGFPIAEILADGSSVITKHDGTGGAVTVDTVTAQLVYEIQSQVYGGPDVMTRLDTMTVEQAGPDRVAITGVTGEPAPDTLKVCLNELGGFRNSVEFLLTGLDIEAKAQLVRDQMEAAFTAGTRPAVVEWHLDRTDVADPATQAAATSLLRLNVKDPRPEPVGRALSDAAVQLALASYPGFSVSRPPGPASPYGVYRAAYIPNPVAPPTPAPTPATAGNVRFRDGESSTFAPLAQGVAALDVPLGRLAYARSGDKGGNANIGVWIPADHPARSDAYQWLASYLDAARVRDLLPEARDLDVEVYHLPNISAINIVIVGLLGEGVASSTRLDPQAKGLGEWLRARVCPIPEFLLPDSVKENAL